MKKLIVWFKGLSIGKKVGVGVMGALVLFTIFGLVNLGKFSENSAIFRTRQPSRLERSKPAQKDEILKNRQKLSESKQDENLKEQAQPPEKTESQTPSENASKAEQPPAQSQNEPQTSGKSESPTQPAPSEKSPPETVQAPDTSGQPPSASVTEDNDESPSAPSEAKFVGSLKTMIYHTLDCPLAKKIPQEERIWFSSPDEALDLEYNPCTMCPTPN